MKLPPILTLRPTPDESLFEYRVCPFCRGPKEFSEGLTGMDCMECGRHWTRIIMGGNE